MREGKLRNIRTLVMSLLSMLRLLLLCRRMFCEDDCCYCSLRLDVDVGNGIC
jgi:hypothetical protein